MIITGLDNRGRREFSNRFVGLCGIRHSILGSLQLALTQPPVKISRSNASPSCLASRLVAYLHAEHAELGGKPKILLAVRVHTSQKAEGSQAECIGPIEHRNKECGTGCDFRHSVWILSHRHNGAEPLFSLGQTARTQSILGVQDGERFTAQEPTCARCSSRQDGTFITC